MQAVDRLSSILNTLANSPRGLILSDLARGAHLPIPTTLRLVSALAQHGLVEQDRAGKRYRLGAQIARLSRSLLDHDGLRDRAAPHMEELRDRWQESFYLCEFVGGRVVCLAIAQAERHIGFYIRPGREMPLHSCASAKAILAHQPVHIVKARLGPPPFVAYTPHTITSLDAYLRELQRAREIGYAVCDQEMEIGLLAVAAPLWTEEGGAGASLGVLGPLERMRRHMKNNLLSDVLDTAAEISSTPGHAGAHRPLKRTNLPYA